MSAEPDDDARPRTLREELTSHEMRERYRTQMLASIGGWSGSVIAAIPTVVFVIVNFFASLRTAVFAAVGAAVVLALYRLARRQSALQAVSGLVGVVIAAAIAGGTGQARNYFLIGIVTSFVYGAAFLISMLVRRPLVGLVWEFLDPIGKHHPSEDDVEPADEPVAGEPAPSLETVEPPDSPDSLDPEPPWYRHRQLLRAYQWATLVGVVLFFARGITQTVFYRPGAEVELGVVKIVMGYPLWIVAVLLAFWIVRRTRHRLYPPAPTA